ncbi:MAG: 16S rRNA (adenine(1518)-N(6)/adenine(1519)-N(6))-dimethyltransferase RsmA [Candidatus Diapherotrites archaeon]|nr:16S rRNA (adenine(1518)-N(6)/adenine(1519)-N(6))-dimethyltransferase RsmA [Candidatus Diapherotrites archaeon]MDZ4256492.1 16S rRNA (adenine(1518)-N(6)/adenine(1519)-N(6))-dimethyltransferase RsmA [archaeon]
MGGLDELQRDMVAHSFFPDKKFSQHFLVDESIIHLLVDSVGVGKKNSVLEIGGGTGFVTRAIRETGARVIVVEVHAALAAVLQEKLGDQNEVRIIQNDILKVNLNQLDFDTVIASPPYAISDDIMYALFARGFDNASLVWQLEFAEKLLAPEGSAEYNALSVLTQYFFNGDIVKKISPKAFYPMPQQFSSILVLKRKKVPPIPNHAQFVEFIRTLFRFKNKTLANALRLAARHIPTIPSSEQCALLLRPFDWAGKKVFLLSPVEFVALYHALLHLPQK